MRLGIIRKGSIGTLLIVGPVVGVAITWSLRAGHAVDTALANQHLERLKAQGTDASMTILPVGLAGRPSPQVGEVLGMLLERAGMMDLEIGTATFQPDEKADLAQTAASLGEFVKAHPPKTDFVLFADFLGTPGQSVSEVRSVIVTQEGEAAWQDRQTPNDPDFKRIKPGEPMTCCLLAVERLRTVLNLGDPSRAKAPQGKLTQQWREKTGLPDEAEWNAMGERRSAFKKSAPSATMLIYPVRAGGENSAQAAAHLVGLINGAKLTNAVAASRGPDIDVQGNMNEQKVLWDMARAARDHVRKEPPKEDYVLFADFRLGDDRVGGVHFVVCDQKGDWVIVDFQNDHQADFKAIQPKSIEDCDRLVLKRLEGYGK
jgi:hypothetical protein